MQLSEAPLVTPALVAQWRGASEPDRIDVLISSALSARGEYSGDDLYQFSGNESAIKTLRTLPEAFPRLVECLGWDKRARATYEGSPVLVGVVCYQGMAGSVYRQRLRNESLPPTGLWVDFKNPSIAELRKTQALWQEILQRTAASSGTIP
ncbi:MAG: hypothetical protein ACJ794_00240 [Gemmatimonadaceae bacterium]